MLPPLESGWACDHCYVVYHCSGVPRTAWIWHCKSPRKQLRTGQTRIAGHQRGDLRVFQCWVIRGQAVITLFRGPLTYGVRCVATGLDRPCVGTLVGSPRGAQPCGPLPKVPEMCPKMPSTLQTSRQACAPAACHHGACVDTLWDRKIHQQGLILLLTFRVMKYTELVVSLSH